MRGANMRINDARRAAVWHQQRVLALILEHEAISYDDIAIALEIDRMTAIHTVEALVHAGVIERQRGSGRKPNRYLPALIGALC